MRSCGSPPQSRCMHSATPLKHGFQFGSHDVRMHQVLAYRHPHLSLYPAVPFKVCMRQRCLTPNLQLHTVRRISRTSPSFLYKPSLSPPLSQNYSGLKKAELAALIRRQVSCWPKPPFNPSKTTIADMKQALLDHRNGFTISKIRSLEDSPLSSAPPTPGPMLPGGGDAGSEGRCTNDVEEMSREEFKARPILFTVRRHPCSLFHRMGL